MDKPSLIRPIRNNIRKIKGNKGKAETTNKRQKKTVLEFMNKFLMIMNPQFGQVVGKTLLILRYHTAIGYFHHFSRRPSLKNTLDPKGQKVSKSLID